ncbi:unnamed protein product [Hydatigera taeniaeformis]|uniref:Uncharacterized protein n=1 Tax=Hydatigena taeniaeformis TaxID=6205 RepID=A0A0R3WWV2_HYDTA|nr:unnamed protein product [Hydatigera taeniaeformis]
MFSEVHHLDSLVIQHIGVYTVCPVSSLTSFTEPSESHTQEIIKLSSFLGSSPHQAIASARPDSQSNHQRLYKCITTSSVPTVESQRGKSASSPAVISGDKDVVAPTGEKLHTLCSQFLTSLYQPQRPPEFWEKCVSSLMFFGHEFLSFFLAKRKCLISSCLRIPKRGAKVDLLECCL